MDRHKKNSIFAILSKLLISHAYGLDIYSYLPHYHIPHQFRIACRSNLYNIRSPA
jgi:hypothetical protein